MDSEVHLLEGTEVYVVVPDTETEAKPVYVRSPRLVVRELTNDFKMEIVKA